ncbi:MAG TPA: signal peptidase I [Candidatus Saccharimonadales bacterium]|nr:signal peptidase I [Candidatus Saccharimonadales bacterium]
MTDTINNSSQTIQPDDQSASSKEVVTSQRRPSRFGELLSTVVAVVAALGLAVLLIAFVFQSYQVDGPSMETTLQNSDRLIVWKVPRTWARITGHAYVPKRGDVVIFNQDNLAEFGQTNVKQLVKRVIGLPGDRVVIANGHVTIYNKQNPNGFNPDATLPYGKEHSFPVTSGDIDTTLRSNQIFVCGDNRTDSLDSRAFGPVDLNNVVGKLVLRVYPLSTVKRF